MSAFPELQSLMQALYPVTGGHELIRLGPKGDGGYLVPDDLDGIAACFSPGVSRISGFERACAKRGMEAFLADKSVDGPAVQHERFHFTKKFLGAFSNDDFMTLDSWVSASLADATSDLLLQIDIEGYEYEVFLSASEALMRRFRIIVAEFHMLTNFWRKPFFTLASRAFDKILQTHACVHIHPNNCCGSVERDGLEIPRVMEFTFLRRDRITQAAYQRTFPHPLDCDNTRKPTFVLPTCWYSPD